MAVAVNTVSGTGSQSLGGSLIVIFVLQMVFTYKSMVFVASPVAGVKSGAVVHVVISKIIVL